MMHHIRAAIPEERLAELGHSSARPCIILGQIIKDEACRSGKREAVMKR